MRRLGSWRGSTGELYKPLVQGSRYFVAPRAVLHAYDYVVLFGEPGAVGVYREQEWIWRGSWVSVQLEG